MPSFNEDSAASGSMDLIPAGTIAWATVVSRGIKTAGASAKAPGARMADLELVIASGPFQRRKVWHLLMDPDDMLHGETARTMATGQIVRMLEAIGYCVPGQPQTYQRQEIATFEGCIAVIERGIQSGRYIGVKVGIEKGTGGYKDKNQIESYLTPNPKSGSARNWQILQTGDKPGESSAPRPGGGQQMAAGFAPASGGFSSGGFGAPTTAAAPPNALAQPAWVGGQGGSAPTQTQPGAHKLNDDIPF